MPLFGSKRQQSSPVRDDRYADDRVNDTTTHKDGFFSRARGNSRARRRGRAPQSLVVVGPQEARPGGLFHRPWPVGVIARRSVRHRTREPTR